MTEKYPPAKQPPRGEKVERMPDSEEFEYSVDTDEMSEGDERMTKRKTIVKTGGG